jgi:TonB-dependent receptor
MKAAKSLFLFAALLLGISSVLAQEESGRIHGVVKDASSGDVLPGAIVELKGTSLGTAANLSGEYAIRAIPLGSYILSVRYLGYRSKEMPIEVKAGADLEYNFSLTVQAIEGQEVVVLAQAKGQMEAINQQLASNTITNVVSAERIRELPDASAAAALSRLPGVSLMNGDQIVIRGIQAKNNIILVNGIRLPSTDVNTRSVNLGFFSSTMLSGIEVIKALTPDMDANSIGGVVNLRLAEAPENFHFDLFTQGNYNRQDRTTDNYKFWGSASDRFLDDQLGVFLQANADRTNAGSDLTSAGYAIYQNLPYGLAPYRMNNFTFNDQVHITTNYGGSVLLDYRLPHGKILFQNALAHTRANNIDYKYYMDFTVLSGLTYTLTRDDNHRNLLVNSLQAEYDFGALKTELTLSHSYSDKRTDVRYGDPGDNLSFSNATDPHPYGVDANGNPISYSGLRETLTPEDVYRIQIDPNDPLGASLNGWAVTRGEAFTERLYNATLDFTLPVTFSEDLSASFKLGGKLAPSKRTNDLEEHYKRVGDNDFYEAVPNFLPYKVLSNTSPLLLTDIWNQDYTRGQYFLKSTYDMKYVVDADQMDAFLPLASTAWKPGRHRSNSERYDFDGRELFSAGYLMGTFNIGPRLRVLGGARFEHYNMDYTGTFVYVTHSVDGVCLLFDTLNTVNRNDDDLLPNVQMRYQVTDWADLRLAYTQTLSRPDYQAILPNTYFEPGASGQGGNTKLKPTLSKNYDVSVSFHDNNIGLFTIGGFYKKLDDVFFATTIYFQNLGYYNLSFPDSATWLALGVQAPSQSTPISTFINNRDPARVRGVELEWQTRFWYLPSPFDALVLNINYTRVWSDMDYQQLLNIDSTYQVGRFTFHKYLTRDTTYNARLLNQGDHILNIALGVDYKGFSGRVSFNLQSNVITSVSPNGRREADQFTGTIYRLDLSLKQALPVEGLSVSFDVQNLTHSPVDTYQRFCRTPGGPIGDNIASTRYDPTFYQLSLRYSM